MDRYDRELRVGGRAVIRTRRWKVVLMASFGALMTLACTLILVVPDAGPGVRLLSTLLILTFGALTTACVWRAVTRRPALVVDSAGVALGRRRAAWSEIASFRVIRVRYSSIAVVHGRDGSAPLAGSNRLLRWMARHSGSTLPTGLEVGPHELVDWLSAQHRRFRRR